MRGADRQQVKLFSHVSPEERVPRSHPLRAIRQLVNQALQELPPQFDAQYARGVGRPSIPPEQLLRALLLQMLYTIRSEQQLMEQLEYNILFRWFVGFEPDERVWDVTVFTKSRDRLLAGDIAQPFFQAVLAAAERQRLLSEEHFTVDSTLVHAWAGQKSLQPIGARGRPPSDDDPGNPSVDFRGQRRSNATHRSTMDPDARLAKRAPGQVAKLAYAGHVLMDNRHGLAVMEEEKRILIVDDDDGTRRRLGFMLGEHSYEIESAETASAAVAKLRARPFNVAIVDTKLPDMEGAKLVAALKQIQPDLMAIMVTACATVQNAVRALNEGASAYLAKPLNVDQALTAVRTALERQRLVRENRRLYEEAQKEIAQRKRVEEALRREEIIVASSTDMLALICKKFTYLAVNTAYLEAFGMTRDQLVGHTVAEVFGEEFFSEVIKPHAERCMAGEEVRYQAWFDFPVTGRQYMQFTYDRYTRADNEVEGFVVNARNVTERKRVEEELKRSNEELEQFAYVASHDLQEPLRMVASYTELLGKRYEGKLDEKADKYIRYAVDGAKRMQQLINDLLAFSRVGSRRTPLKPTACDAVVDQVVCDMQQIVMESRAEVTREDLPTVLADELELAHVWQNLISNAIKFRRQDPPRVRIKAQHTGSDWVFSVHDNGIGIEMGQADRIFRMFQRLHQQGTYPGSGVGLAITKRIIDRHGGRVWFESEVGKGSIFYFSIPAAGASFGGSA